MSLVIESEVQVQALSVQSVQNRIVSISMENAGWIQHKDINTAVKIAVVAPMYM